MGDIVNLKRARKARERASARAEASQNRTRHGRTAADKTRQAEEGPRTDARLDGHKRDRTD